MKKTKFNKGIVAGFIVLFFGASIIQGVSLNNSSKNLSIGPIKDTDCWPMFRYDKMHTGYTDG